MTKTLQEPEDQWNYHFTFVVYFFHLLCALKCFRILKWTHLSKANHLYMTKRSAIVHYVYPQYLNWIILYPVYECMTESWWGLCSFNAAGVTESFEKISHLHYNISYCIFDCAPWAAGRDLIRLFMLHNACLSLAGQTHGCGSVRTQAGAISDGQERDRDLTHRLNPHDLAEDLCPRSSDKRSDSHKHVVAWLKSACKRNLH